MPASWVTGDLLAAVPDFARIAAVPASSPLPPPSLSLDMAPGFRSAYPARRLSDGLSCAATNGTELVIEGKGPLAALAPGDPQRPPAHTIGAILKDPKGAAPTVRISPSWNPLEAAADTSATLMARGQPGADYELSILSLAPAGQPFRTVEDPDSLALHQGLLEAREKSRKHTGAPYREPEPALKTGNAALYEVRFVLFPVVVITVMDLQTNFISLDAKSRTIRFELRKYNDLPNRRQPPAPSQAVLRLSEAEWNLATEERGLVFKERILRPSNFWTLLTREVMRNLLREKLETLFVSASQEIESLIAR